MLKVSAVMLRSLHSMLQTMEMLPVRVVLGALPPNTLEEPHYLASLTCGRTSTFSR